MPKSPYILATAILAAVAIAPPGCQKQDQHQPAPTPTTQEGPLEWIAGKLLGDTQEQRRQQLLTSLTSPDADIRRQGAMLLGTKPSADWETTPEILRMMTLGDKNEHVQATALRTLAKVGTSDVLATTIAKAASNPSAIVRAECIAVTTYVESNVAVATLTSMLAYDSDAEIRRAAAAALANYRERQAINALLTALSDDEFKVSYAARRSLKQLTGRDLGDDPDAWRSWLFAGADPLAAPTQ
jgi:HEAT repeat protein